MEEPRYMISDAARKVNVEAHVLRYWEEELELDIPRNEMGHRYYTDEYIHIFRQVRQLKESGYQLKAIKMLLPRIKDMNDDELRLLSILSEEMNRQALETDTEKKDAYAPILQNESAEPTVPADNIVPMPTLSTASAPTAPVENPKLIQFQTIMTEILSNALQKNHDWFFDELEHRISDRMLKEINYNMRQLEEMQEDHFRRIDAALSAHREAAAARVEPKRRLGRKMRKKQETETEL
ncbi:MAG: MerR family transcriptional regulator [Lachnospiraceae bacterium]|nr:MerR family transcriptional regulator [Lachnospiraceae bacterium]